MFVKIHVAYYDACDVKDAAVSAIKENQFLSKESMCRYDVMSMKKTLIIPETEIGELLNRRHLLNKYHRCSSDIRACFNLFFSEHEEN